MRQNTVKRRLILFLFLFLFLLIILLISGRHEAIAEMIAAGSRPNYVAFSPDGKYIYVSNYSDDTIAKIELSTGDTVAVYNTGYEPLSLCLLESKNKLYAANRGDGTISEIDLSSGASVSFSIGNSPWDIVSSPDGDRLYVSLNGDKAIKIFDTTTGEAVATIQLEQTPTGLAITADGSRLFVANRDDDSISLIDPEGGNVVDTIGVGDGPAALECDGNGNYLYVANSYDGTISVVRTWDFVVIKTVEVGRNPIELGMTHSGDRLFVSCNGDDTLYAIDTDTLSTTKIEIEGGPKGLAVSPDDSQICVACFTSDSILRFYNYLIKVISISKNAVNSQGTSCIRWVPETAGNYSIEVGGNYSPSSGTILETGQCQQNLEKESCIRGSQLGQAEGTYRIFLYLKNDPDEYGLNSTEIRLDNTPPSAPTGLEASPGNHKVYLAWNRGSESDLQGYRIYYGTKSGIYDAGPPITIWDADETSYILKELKNNVTYYIAITAFDEAGNESAYSSETKSMPEVILGLAGLSGAKQKEGCFIATASFGSPDHWIVRKFRFLRDHYILRLPEGRRVAGIYYRYSPGIARFIERNKMVRTACRVALLIIAMHIISLQLFGKIWPLSLTIMAVFSMLFIIPRIRKNRGGS